MKKIAFVFFDAGGGHRAAATALKLAIESENLPWNVELHNLQEILDPLDILKKYAGIRIQDFYNRMLRNGWTLGSPQLMRVLQLTILLYHRASVRLLTNYWKESQPDMVVSFVPHFNRALQQSYAHAFANRPFVTILTDLADYPPHFWIERQQQYLVCGTDRAVEQAHEKGHTDEFIFRTSGMILHPRFYCAPTQDRCVGRSSLGLRPNIPTGIVLFGGFGSQSMTQIAEHLERSSLDLQMIYVCGHNEKVRQELNKLPMKKPRVTVGFVTNVNEYMHLADFFIGKPGPGSISEALAMGLPVIVERNAWTLPQERYNAEWIVENKVGMVLRNFRQIESAVASLIEPSTLASYRARAQQIENRAIYEIPSILDGILRYSEDS